MIEAFYEPLPGGSVRATPRTTGPWSLEAQHGGPVGGLMARALETVVPRGFQVCRVTMELLRPVPIGVLQTTAELTWRGWAAAHLTGELRSGGHVCVRARAAALRPKPLELPELPPEPTWETPPEGLPSEDFAFFGTHEGFHKAIDCRIVEGAFEQGPTRSWFRQRVPLVAGEEPTPLQRLMVAADCGNGLSICMDIKRYTFINPDLSVVVHRLPAGEWIGMDARTRPTAAGIGTSDTLMLDERGPLGRAMQTLVLAKR